MCRAYGPVGYEMGTGAGGIDSLLAAASLNRDHNAMYEDAKPKVDSNSANIRF